jgi:CBS domain-containing protein/mannitol/fructose-specific phosphotransferase system IIA component (Ntr-type)
LRSSLLSDYLPAHHVTLPLQARGFNDALREMVAKLVEHGEVRDPDELYSEIEKAGSRDIVEIDPDVSLPHFRTEAVDKLLVCLGIAREPVEGARIIALIIAPPEAATLYLQTVAALARFFEGRDVVKRLFEAQAPDEVASMPELANLKIRPHLTVHDLMTHGATTITPDMNARDAVDIMVRKKLRALPVVSAEGQVLGIVSEWDIMRALLPHIPSANSDIEEKQDEDEEYLVRDVMSRSVMCVSEEMGLAEAVNLMLNKKVEQTPVVKDAVFTGMLTRSDIIRKLFGR